MTEVEYVDRIPNTCWQCATRIRGTRNNLANTPRQAARRQKAAQAKIFFAWVTTLIVFPLVLL